MSTLAILVLVALPSLAADTPVRPLSNLEFRKLVKQCAPDAPLSTLHAIAKVESSFHPLAILINYPEKAAATLGIDEGTVSLSRQPTTVREAIQWTKWLYSRGLTVSIGLMQVNAEHIAGLGLSLEQTFEPCTNLKAGWSILKDKYRAATAVLGKGQSALRAAISAYNTGSLTAGVRNGYVQNVTSEGKPRMRPPYLQNDQPLTIGTIAAPSDSQVTEEPAAGPEDAPTRVPWLIRADP